MATTSPPPTLFVLAAALSVSACGGDTSTPTAPPAQSPPAEATPQTRPAPGEWKYLIFFVEADPEVGEAPLTVQFSVYKDSDSGVQPISWHWNFGDGAESSEARPVHTYERPGIYTVKVEGKDARGDTDDDDVDIVVKEPASG
jgi:PKD repeat protein